MNPLEIFAMTEKGRWGMMYTKFFWSRMIAAHTGKTNLNDYLKLADLDQAMLNVLRISIEPTVHFILSAMPSFEEFEQWIEDETKKTPESGLIQKFNQAVLATPPFQYNYTTPLEDKLTDEQWKQWNEEGYLIIPGVISPDACKKTIDLIHHTTGINPNDKETWYTKHQSKKGIMIQLFHHDQLEENRNSPKIKHIFEQLWHCNEILPSADRVSFNPPETNTHVFQGPDLHWDTSLKQPIPFGTQGLIYLSDTSPDQGAFTLVPGFHKKVVDWMENLPKDINPRTYNLHTLNPKKISARTGDLIVWNHALPHGSSPNTSNTPRYVQYINYQPLRCEVPTEWI